MDNLIERNQINIEDEMRRSYLDYAMSVIIGRALPDVRDGLKPVHRRVLWAMHELGNTYNKPYKKSARVVGDTIGKYHPHGDTAVYDTVVRLAQDFSLRYPMVDGQGNFGSIDGDNPAAMRYCVTGDAMVVTGRGLVSIGELSDREEIAESVLSHGQKVNTASRWFDCGPHPVKKIRTKHGFEITGTDNHPLLVWEAGSDLRPHFVWKTIAELRPGDFLVLDRSETLWPESEVTLGGFRPAFENPRVGRHEMPESLNEDLAFLLGALVAKGTINQDRVEFGNVEGDFADEFAAAFTRVFPNCRLHRWLREPNSYGKKKWWQMQIVSREVVSLLLNLGLHGRSNEKTIPQAVLESPKHVVAAFLRGLYEGDGAAERSGKSLLRVTLTSVSRDLLKEVQVVLLRFGILTQIISNAGHGRPTFRLCITGFDNLDRFREKIGFISARKIYALDRLIADFSGKTLAKTDYVPFVASYVRERALAGNRGWVGKHNLDRLPRMRRSLGRLQTALEAADFEFVRHIAGSNYVFSPISSISDDGEQRVFSIRVDSDCHSFVANGFVNHNTEVRMAKITNDVLADIEKETVDFQPNYDDSLSEPKVLPTRVPNLLVNGSEGIAVGMATKIPPHNLGEIVDAIVALICDPEISIDDLIKLVPGPDFPTGGFIYGREEIHRAYREGRGIIQMRARAAIDRIGRGDREKDAIVVTEIPYQINKSRLIEKIAELVNDKKLDGISELRDESNREGMRIVIELKRDAVPQVVLNKLYKLTPLQSSFGIINLAIVNGEPRIMNLKEILEHFVEFRREVVRRRTLYELKKAQARAHILEGLNKAIDALDYIIPLIRNSRSVDEAKQWLTGNFATLHESKSWRGVPTDKTLAGFLKDLERVVGALAFSDIQAQAILDLQLRRLSALERQKIIDELEAILKLIAELEAILANEQLLRQVIVDELTEIRKNFGDARRTEIVDAGVELRIEDLIPDEDVAITVTNAGYIKRTPVSVYSKQGRGGKGRLGAKAKNDDFVQHLFIASTHAYLMIFTDDGQVFKIKVHEIPEADPSARGKAVVNLVQLSSERKLVAVMPVRDFEEEIYLTMVTKNGIIKKSLLSEYQNIRVNGINAINIDGGDELLDVIRTDGKQQILIATHDGMAVRFNETDVRPMGRVARGVIGVNLRSGDYCVAVCAVSQDGHEKILSVSENGFGKQTQVSNYRLTKRGGIGVINMKTTEKTGKVVAAFPVQEDSEIMIITEQAKLIRIGVDKIRETGRSAQGVMLIRTGDEDRVTSASLLEGDEEEE